MTVAVARHLEHGTVLVADTKVTRLENASIPHYGDVFPGAMKVFVVDRNACFAFAGVCQYAFDALRELVSTQDRSRKRIKSILKDAHKASRGETDFILCTGKTKIERISDRRTTSTKGGQIFLGNHRAVNLMSDDLIDTQSILLGNNDDLRSVGGLIVKATNIGGGFAYLNLARVGVSVEGAQSTYLGSNEDHLNVICVGPRNICAPFYAAYYPDANFGYLYDHVHNERPVKVCGSTFNEFREKVQDSLQIEFSDGGCGVKISVGGNDLGGVEDEIRSRTTTD